MSARSVLVYVLSAVAALTGLIIIINDISLANVLSNDIVIRDVALGGLGIAVGIIAPILYRKYSSAEEKS
ncbi:hypothetical protein [Thermoproteus tenax]|uniref:Uncharacterized protein n=1 Tax=Thermoproteus tenax (strain ATCC 35583 / DSM 2078 / JCM 9277 / NBRC 100435 / Kra 1) TaxID=768679 RepID=G4RMN5_THETK|nr:hypothetical protein [Thermoproteus tenax]CCC82711.1 hypothetical protein TTX_2099 [Thermoproteus tenax Kra 1]